MPTTISTQYAKKHTSSSPLHSYHSDVMQAMCSQMVHHRRRGGGETDMPLPLAKKPTHNNNSTTTPSSTPASSRQSGFSQHVQEEMARRVKADRVLQDLSSDKSRQQARARETARRNKWAKSIANACPAPSAESASMKKTMVGLGYEDRRRKNPIVA